MTAVCMHTEQGPTWTMTRHAKGTWTGCASTASWPCFARPIASPGRRAACSSCPTRPVGRGSPPPCGCTHGAAAARPLLRRGRRLRRPPLLPGARRLRDSCEVQAQGSSQISTAAHMLSALPASKTDRVHFAAGCPAPLRDPGRRRSLGRLRRGRQQRGRRPALRRQQRRHRRGLRRLGRRRPCPPFPPGATGRLRSALCKRLIRVHKLDKQSPSESSHAQQRPASPTTRQSHGCRAQHAQVAALQRCCIPPFPVHLPADRLSAHGTDHRAEDIIIARGGAWWCHACAVLQAREGVGSTPYSGGGVPLRGVRVHDWGRVQPGGRTYPAAQ